MPAYFVAIREAVTDPAEMKIYGEKTKKSFTGHELAIRAAFGKVRSTEGAEVDGAVIMEFPTFEAAEAWYDSEAYQEAMAHRLRGSTFRTFILQGLN